MKKLIAFLLCAVLLCTAMPVAFAAAKEPFVPVLRFIACSDSHVKTENDLTTNRIGAMLSQVYALTDADPVYPNLDALMMAGDLTHDGTKEEFTKYWNAVSAAKRDSTDLLAVVAKSHDGWGMTRKKMRSYFSDLTGEMPDFHKVVCGYHFIGLSVSENDAVHYSKKQLSWLREQLELAVADTPDRPVFFMHHEHNRDTVYGSSFYDGWGVKYFNKILKDYPQVVDFSGHSHYPLNDPRSIWQGNYTAIGTGALYYAEFTIGAERAYKPADCEDCGTYWIVEVNAAGDVHLCGFDVDANKLLCEYTLPNPADPQNRPFDQEKMKAASTAPAFAADAVLTAEETGKGNLNVTAPAAASTDGQPITLYRVTLKNKIGIPLEKQWYLPRYYVANGRETTIPFSFKSLPKGSYTVCVVAETAYGVQSAPLETTVTVEHGANAFVVFFLLLARPFKLLIDAIKAVA